MSTLAVLFFHVCLADMSVVLLLLLTSETSFQIHNILHLKFWYDTKSRSSLKRQLWSKPGKQVIQNTLLLVLDLNIFLPFLNLSTWTAYVSNLAPAWPQETLTNYLKGGWFSQLPHLHRHFIQGHSIDREGNEDSHWLLSKVLTSRLLDRGLSHPQSAR